MAYPSVTYSFTNGTTISATEVNQNFTDLINGLSDGTKDLNISALTAAGTANLNGAVNLGNATSDDVTVTGYLASALIPKTDDTYDLGTAALAWQDAYFDGAVYTDTISELGSGVGVTIDGVLLKDNSVSASTSCITPLIKAYDGNGITMQENGGTQIFAVSDAGEATVGRTGAVTASRINHNFHNPGNTGSCSTLFGPNSALADTEYYELGFRSNVSGVEFGVVGMHKVSANTYPQPYFCAHEIGSNDNFVWGKGGKLLISTTRANIGTSTGTVVGDQTSDERLKTIEESFPYGLEDLLKLKPIRFSMNNETRIGFGAQTTRATIPELVYTSGEVINEGEETKLVMRNGNDMCSVLVKAIQELSAQVDTLQAEVAALKAK